ncbi:MAG: universal stress protein [Flavobacteriales bacterium]|nr:universal stress protein [Flavobacteriales bacterium]
MGTQGASGVKEVFMGTNTADVIKHSRLPVLAVPEQARHTGSTRIVLADDGVEWIERRWRYWSISFDGPAPI